jgi:hypothetical protein
MAMISSCHRSIDPTVSSVAIPFINIIMDPQCILWQPYLASLYHPSIGMPALGLKHVIIFVGFLCASSIKFSASIPLLKKFYKVLQLSCLLTSYFGGKSVTPQNYSTR